MSLYLEHFGLREAPFRITPHTEFFFSGGNRGATLDALVYAITHDEGIVKVTGEVGSGKTMLCRMLLERLPAHVETIYLANPSMTRDEILFALADELKMDEPPARIHQLLRTIQQKLVALYAAGRQIVMLIDEAHAMPAESLEEIRLLSNLESNRHKLLQIVLFGQPELDELLSRTEMRQLRERVTHNFALEPLHRQDIGSYIGFRLRAAGYRGPDPFTPAAIQLIAESSAGLTRRINILADKALLAAFSQNLYQIDSAQAKAAIRDAHFGPMPGQRRGIGTRKALFAGGAVAGLAAAAGVTWLAIAPAAMPPAEKATSSGAPQKAVPAPEVRAAASPVATPTRPIAPEPVPEPPANTAPNAKTEPPANPPVAAAPASLDSTSVPDPQSSADALLDQGLKSFAAWLPQAADNRYFIQLLRTQGNNAREVENFLKTHGKALDADKLRVYRSSINGQSWLGVIYGDFPSRDDALLATHRLPAAVRANGPYPRAVKMLR